MADFIRPTVDVALLGMAHPDGRILTVRDSMDRFRTVAFGIEMMRDLILFNGPTLEIGPWFGVVPEVYREAVLEIVMKRFETHWRGEMCTRESLYAVAEDFNRAIGRELQPIDPGAVDG